MWLSNSSIGRKVVMSITGLFLVLFLTFHMCMNLVALILSLIHISIKINMKNSNFFLLAITAATVVSCGTHPSSYTINGTVSDTTLNGNKVYLTDMASRNVLDLSLIHI